MSTRWARVARGLLAAIFSTLIAACSHSLVGHGAPSMIGIALTLAFASVLCVFLAGRTFSLLRLSVSVGLSQFAFHGAFSLLTDAPATVSPATSASHSMVGMPGMGSGLATGLSGANVTATPAMPVHDPAMWVAHAIAAVLTVLVLRLGEAAGWKLIELTGLAITARFERVLALALPAEAAPKPSRMAVARSAVARPVTDLRSSLSHRGPPRIAAAS